MRTFAIVSLGCSRNSIDSEVIAGSLKKSGMRMTDIDPTSPFGLRRARDVDLVVVNTCAFIESAREESVEKIIELAELKKSGKIKQLVVCGCLGQLYKEKLAKELPEVDVILGVPGRLYDDKSPRLLLTPAHWAYVKISEGCSNFCSYCIISRLRGHFRSRSINSVIKEVRKISRGGRIKEINLVGQDTTRFGFDRYGKLVLPELLRKLCALDTAVRWIRILYTHPAHYTDELIEAVRDEEKICKYLDLPIQHISDKILKAMKRRVTAGQVKGLIEKLRDRIPGLTLRTSIIVGFPGESDRDFRELMDFVRETKFERLGAFIYSKEEGTAAGRMPGQVSEKVKEARLDELMKLQQSISLKANRALLNKAVDVLIDEEEGEKFVGRTEGHAPEVDGVVYVSGKNIKVGEFYKVKITDALEYDLIGDPAPS